MKRTFKILGIVVLLILCGLALYIGNIVLKQKREQPQMIADPVFEQVPPVINVPEDGFKVLVFSKTNGFRHHEAIPAAKQLLQEFSDAEQWSAVFTDNGAVFNPQQLAQFDVVVWNNVSGPVLTQPQQEAFENYLTTGGGYLGIHAAGDGSHKGWPWYAQKVIRSQFTMHPMWPQLQVATLNTEQSSQGLTRNLPQQWSMKDEWYSFESSVRYTGSTVLLTVDEHSYDPNFWAMGEDHPLVWLHEVGRGRVVYSAPGHMAAVYQDEHYRSLLLESIRWVGRVSD